MISRASRTSSRIIQRQQQRYSASNNLLRSNLILQNKQILKDHTSKMKFSQFATCFAATAATTAAVAATACGPAGGRGARAATAGGATNARRSPTAAPPAAPPWGSAAGSTTGCLTASVAAVSVWTASPDFSSSGFESAAEVAFCSRCLAGGHAVVVAHAASDETPDPCRLRHIPLRRGSPGTLE